jgi:hypothetical protein
MPDLNFAVTGVEPHRYAAEPTLLFKLRVTEFLRDGRAPATIHSVLLRCQVRIDPARRKYSDEEKERLRDLFGAPERWGQTVRPMLWTHATFVVPPLSGSRVVDLPIPCSSDFTLAATKYFGALDQGEIPLCFLFSGTIFHEGPTGGLEVEQISWEKEAVFRLGTAAWTALMEQHYPNRAWLSLRKDVFENLLRYKSQEGLATWEQTIDRLLAAAAEEEELSAP